MHQRAGFVRLYRRYSTVQKVVVSKAQNEFRHKLMRARESVRFIRLNYLLEDSRSIHQRWSTGPPHYVAPRRIGGPGIDH